METKKRFRLGGILMASSALMMIAANIYDHNGPWRYLLPAFNLLVAVGFFMQARRNKE